MANPWAGYLAEPDGTIRRFLSALDHDEGKRGAQFELATRWLFENSPSWKSQIGKVWSWDEYREQYDLGSDTGIDLVLQMYDGRWIPVQCKCYQESTSIGWGKISTFLSKTAGSHKQGTETINWSTPIVVTTTDRRSPRLVPALDEAHRKLTVIGLAELDMLGVSWPAAPITGSPTSGGPVAALQPEPHQKDAINAILDAYGKGKSRGQCIMACGTGKTLVAVKVAELLRLVRRAQGAGRVLFAAPTIALLANALRCFQNNHDDGPDWRYLAVCGDKTVTDRDDIGAEELGALGVAVTTDPKEIAKFMRDNPRHVIFTTYASCDQVVKGQQRLRLNRSSRHTFDLVVCDEAHRLAGAQGRAHNLFLQPDKLGVNKWLFMTATPKIYNAKTDAAIYSMDDEKIFGEVIHVLPFSTAIADGLLSDFRIAVIGLTASQLQIGGHQVDVDVEHQRVVIDGQEYDLAAVAAAVALHQLADHPDHPVSKVLSFHSSIERSKRFVDLVQKVWDLIPRTSRHKVKLHADHASSKMNAAVRQTKVATLQRTPKGTTGLLANARLFTEGVDIQALDGVMFVDPKSSQIDIVQGVSRALRKDRANPNKVSVIIVPVIVPEGTDATEAMWASAYAPVIQVVEALRSHFVMEIKASPPRSPGSEHKAGGDPDEPEDWCGWVMQRFECNQPFLEQFRAHVIKQIRRDDPKTKAIVSSMLNQGKSYADIGKFLGIHRDTVRCWVAHYDMEVKSIRATVQAMRDDPQIKGRIMKMKKAGKSDQEIGQALAVKYKTIRSWVAHYETDQISLMTASDICDDPETKTAVFTMLDAGMSYPDMDRAMKVKSGTIRRLVRSYGRDLITVQAVARTRIKAIREDPSTKAILLEMIAAKKSYQDIGQAFGVSASCIPFWIRDYGIGGASPQAAAMSQRDDPETKATIMKMIEANEPYAEIARVLGVAPHTARRWVSYHDLAYESPEVAAKAIRDTPHTKTTVMAMKKAGKSHREIAKALGVWPNTVSSWMRYYTDDVL